MSDPQTRTERLPRYSLSSVAPTISMVVLLAVLCVVTFAAMRSPLKDDIAWLLYVARRWMAGRELYIDVVEVNPPLIVWLSAIPLAVGRWFDLSVHQVAMTMFIATVLGCAWWTAGMLRRPGGLFADRVTVFAIIGVVLLVMPAGEVGQREHLLIALTLPYLVLFALSLQKMKPGFWPAVFAGVAAGVGCALKPRYAGLFVVLEVIALTRGLWPWRVLPLAAGLTMGAYAAVVAMTAPAYIQRAVPMALALYGATDVPFMSLLRDSFVLMVGSAVAAALLWFRWRSMRERDLMLVLVTFSVVSLVICFMDGKDWYYHRLPATVTTVLALIVWVASALRDSRARAERPPLLAMGVAALAMVVLCVGALHRLEPQVAQAVEPEATTVVRLEQIIRKENARTYIAFSEWIALGFPVVNNTGVSWASRFDSMWALKGELWRARFDPTVAREWPVARWVVHDFLTGCPDIAVVDTREGLNYIAVLSDSDPAFARAWSRYRQIDAFDGLTIYRRGKAGCIDPWIAAEGDRRARR
ncbi:MAG: hypothetical protein AB7F35_07985 [Acetobacteraceae bacterium]